MQLSRKHADPKIQWLADQPWWSDLSPEDLAALAATGDRTDVPAGQRLMRQGQVGMEAAVVVSGELDVVRDGEVVARLGPGDVVGELSLLDGAPRTADVRTATDTELLVFSRTSFQQVQHLVAGVQERVRAAASAHRG